MLGIDDEDDAVDALQDEFARRVVVDLARHRIQVEPGLKAVDRAQLQREEIEEKGPVGIRGQRDHFPLDVVGEFLVDIEEIRRLAAKTATVVDDLAVYLPG
jgi:hypothetical protein